MKKLPLLSCLIFFFAFQLFVNHQSYAQDPHFSNFQATFLYLNPAFAGTSGDDWRVNVNWRKQWPKIAATTTNFLAAEYARGNWGFGINALHDRAGVAPLTTTQTSLSFSHTICLRNDFQLVHGYQINYYNKRLGGDYVFVDDFLNNTNQFPATEITNNTLNLSLGYLLIYKNLWAGVSLTNIFKNPPLNTSNFGLISTGDNSDGRYYGKLSVHGGFSNAPFIRNLLRLSGAANYRQLGQANQFEMTLSPSYRVNDNTIVGVGVGYRGLFPISGDLSREDAMLLNVGVRIPKGFSKSEFYRSSWMLMFSHDFTTSALESTGGSYEITLVLQWSDLRPQSNRRREPKCKKYIPSLVCPDFDGSMYATELNDRTKAKEKKFRIKRKTKRNNNRFKVPKPDKEN